MERDQIEARQLPFLHRGQADGPVGQATAHFAVQPFGAAFDLVDQRFVVDVEQDVIQVVLGDAARGGRRMEVDRVDRIGAAIDKRANQVRAALRERTPPAVVADIPHKLSPQHHRSHHRSHLGLEHFTR